MSYPKKDTPGRPVMRYHGGKWRIAPWVISHFPKHSMYVEPFGGAASVLMRKDRAKCEVYNDMDSEIVNVFRVLRDSAQALDLARLLTLTPHSREEFECAYTPSDDPVEQARRTISRSFMGHSSNAVTRAIRNGFRSKRMGASTPAHDWAGYPDCIPAFVHRLQGVVIENRPALDVITFYDSPNTLFYVDPPYLPETRCCAHQSYRHEMTREDHEALAEALHGVKGQVVLSGYDSPLYAVLYSGWTVSVRNVVAEKAAKRTEVLWISPGAAAVETLFSKAANQ